MAIPAIRVVLLPLDLLKSDFQSPTSVSKIRSSGVGSSVGLCSTSSAGDANAVVNFLEITEAQG